MIGRLPIAAIAATCGVVIASLIPAIPQASNDSAALISGAEPLRAVEMPGRTDQKPKNDIEAGTGDERASIRLTDDPIEMADIELAPVQDGTLVRRIVVPGTIVPDADRIVRVSVKLSGTVAELRKKLGDPVANRNLADADCSAGTLCALFRGGHSQIR
jgi:cobalt-zinc-cadmium efflux system membrane fusion protein